MQNVQKQRNSQLKSKIDTVVKICDILEREIFAHMLLPETIIVLIGRK